MPRRPRPARNAAGELLEHAWQAHVVMLARRYGWLVYHPPDNRPATSARGRRTLQDVTPGYPDLTLVRVPELLFVELKTDRGRVSPEQRAWLDALGELGKAAEEVAGSYNFDLAHNDPELITELAVEAHVWRPRDVEAVHDRLARGRERDLVPPP